MSNLYRGPSIDASYQVSDHLGKRFQRRRFFRNRLIRNKNCLWWPCLLMDLDKMSTLHRAPPIDASYQVSVHLAKWFQRRRFLQPIRNKNCLWWPSLLMDRDKMSNLYRGSSIDTSYQVSVHLAEGFQRRRLKCEKLTDDGCKVMAKAHITFGKVSKTGCLMIDNKRYSHGEPFLPSSNHTKLGPLLSIKIFKLFLSFFWICFP